MVPRAHGYVNRVALSTLSLTSVNGHSQLTHVVRPIAMSPDDSAGPHRHAQAWPPYRHLGCDGTSRVTDCNDMP
jgi:hypothetical protein